MCSYRGLLIDRAQMKGLTETLEVRWSINDPYLTIDLTNDECSECNNSNFAIKLSAVNQSV